VRVNELEAEHVIARRKQEAETIGLQRGSPRFWDRARRWTSEQLSRMATRNRMDKHRSQAARILPIVISIVAAGYLASVPLAYFRERPQDFGVDFQFYRDVAARWLANGSFYWPHQIGGPYAFQVEVDVLYPPNALLLFVPFAFLPAIVWWVIPAAVVGYTTWTWRPGRWAIAAMLVLMCWQKSSVVWITGNTDIWVMAAVAAGLRWGWPAALVFLKPSMAPFALIGIRQRSWWISIALLVGVSLVQLPLWFDYLRAFSNLDGVEPDYSVASIPLMLIPFVVWLEARLRESGASAGARDGWKRGGHRGRTHSSAEGDI
jgi:hypothetical protein